MLTSQDAIYRKAPLTLNLFETDLLTGKTPFNYVGISQSVYKKASGVEKAIAIQRLINRTIKNGYEHQLPEKLLESDFNNIDEYNDYSLVDGMIEFRTKKTSRCGDIVLSHYFNWDNLELRDGRVSFSKALTKPRKLLKAYRRLERYKRKLTNRNVIRILGLCYGTGPAIPFFGGYVTLFKRLNVSGTVFDAHPDNGAKALACTKLGLEYLTEPNANFDDACKNGFLRSGVNHRYIEQGEIADWAIADYNLVNRKSIMSKMPEVMDLASRCRRLIAVGSECSRDELSATYCPEAVVVAYLCDDFPFNFYVW